MGTKKIQCLAYLALLIGSLWANCVSASEKFSFSHGYLTEASNWPLWADTLERHDQERSQISDCVTDENACNGRMKALRHLLINARSLNPAEQIRLVNRYINRRRYRGDHRVTTYDDLGGKHVQPNQFATLLEFLKRGGDCEDYATAKYFILRELGFDANKLRIVIGFDRRSRRYHAILAVQQHDDDILLLENDNQIRRNKYSGYRFVYSINEKGVWQHS